MEIISAAKSCKVQLNNPIDISIPLRFNSAQPNFFGVPPARSNAYQGGGFVGDTHEGGSCNVDEYSLIAHCNGTHTECVGHIVNQEFSIQKILQDVFIPATLISVNPEKAIASDESYNPEKQVNDSVITEKLIKGELQHQNEEFLSGLIIRTIPNDSSKMSRDYNQYPASFFSIEAIRCILDLGISHLLVDVPSVDRANDEGKMTCHHLYWGVEPGNRSVDENFTSKKTITEMIYIPDSVEDGYYFVNIQIPPFVSDAAPSRPILFHAKGK